MKVAAQLVFIIGIVWAQEQRSCNITCVPDDEFVNDETTQEWDEYMEALTTATFNPYTLQCFDSGEPLTVDYNSDVIWDLRYKIYNERQNVEQKTLHDCYCDYQSEAECKSEEFRQCLKGVRTSMKAEVATVLQATISKMLFEMASEC